jgi:hypothetical protein
MTAPILISVNYALVMEKKNRISYIQKNATVVQNVVQAVQYIEVSLLLEQIIEMHGQKKRSYEETQNTSREIRKKGFGQSLKTEESKK